MITISLVMIVKNEEAVLARCLDSFKGLCEEIVIVDTTKEIAAKYTDRIYDFEWIQDFSAARNYAFSLATMDYIYSADADEYIDADNRKAFMLLKEAMEPEIELVQMWYVNRHPYATTENYEKDLRPKLFKRLRSWRWTDPVHETVAEAPLVFDSDIKIIHSPVSQHSGRDFGIFKRALAGGERLSDRLLIMYARELLIAGDREEYAAAAPFFKEAYYDGGRDADIKPVCCSVLAGHFRMEENADEFFKWSLKNISMKPCAEVCFELGQYYFDREDYEEAGVWFLNAAEETVPVFVADRGRKRPYEMLSYCYEKMAGLHPEIKDQCLSMAVRYRTFSCGC